VRLARIAGKARATSEDVAEEEDDGIYTRDSPTPRADESQGSTTIIGPNAPASAPRALTVPLSCPSGPSTLHDAGEVARARPEEEKGAHKQVY